MQTEIKTRLLDGKEVERTERSLFTLAELKERDEDGAFSNALSTISYEQDSNGWTTESLQDEISQYIVPEVLAPAGIELDDEGKSIEWDVSPVQGGQFFVLDPAHTTIKARVFLRAMKVYFAGGDWRGKDYAEAKNPPYLYQRQQHPIDLRSKDAWHARHGDVLIVKIRSPLTTEEVDLESSDYDYEFSQQFREDCNTFIKDVCDFAHDELRRSYEGAHSEESLLDLAEMNEWLFDAKGKIA